MNDRVAIDFTDGLAHVRLTRADKMNALDPAMFEAIAGAITKLKDHPGLRVVVLSGEGRAFCAGLDLSGMAGGGGNGNGSGHRPLSKRSHGDTNLPQFVAWGWRTLPVPVIAAVHGVAFGGGFQIMSGADIRIAHPDTRCAIMELKWGLVPDMAGFPLWRGNVRDDVIRELTYTNREFSGREAHAHGFVTRLADDPLAEALDLAKRLLLKNPHAIRAAKRLCNQMADSTDQALLMAESAEQDQIIRTPNQMEAVMAEMQKRAPVFRD